MSTADQVKLPLPLQLVNRAATALQQSGLPPADLSEATLLRVAQAKTGLSDWGADDFRPALRTLLDSYEREADLTPFGRITVQQDLIRLLWNRLRIQDDLKRSPEILRETIRRPLIIAGYPRTGTTLLHNLLAEDPQARVPLAWEFAWPSPPPTRENRDRDWRSRVARLYEIGIRALAPQLSSIHPLSPTGPEECSLLFQHQFVSIIFYLGAHLPTYLDWLLRRDMTADYRYYRRVLQLLQWRCPAEHWALKSPQHLIALDALLTVFPDACIVQTHRDPQKVVPSLASLTATLRKLNNNRVDMEEVGKGCLNLVAASAERAMKVRESADPARFYDVHYQELIADPVGVVRRMYERFGYNYSSEMETGMKHWLSENPQHKHGVHRYSPEQFGLDREVIAERFAAYVERFNVKPEQS
jgi:hypothetical protein